MAWRPFGSGVEPPVLLLLLMPLGSVSAVLVGIETVPLPHMPSSEASVAADSAPAAFAPLHPELPPLSAPCLDA